MKINNRILYISLNMSDGMEPDLYSFAVKNDKNDDTLYCETADVSYVNMNPDNIQGLLLTDNMDEEKSQVFYNSAEKGITYVRDTVERIREYLRIFINEHYGDDDVIKLVGDIDSIQFTYFYKGMGLDGDERILRSHNRLDNVIESMNYDKKETFTEKWNGEIENNSKNPIIQVSIYKRIFDILTDR